MTAKGKENRSLEVGEVGRGLEELGVLGRGTQEC